MQLILSLTPTTTFHYVIYRFTNNLMKRYAGKCHLLVRTNASAAIKTDNSDVNNRRCEKLS